MRRFFISLEEITNPSPTITGSDANHIKNSLRLKPKDKILLFDGSNIEYEAVIKNIFSNKVEVSIIRKFSSTPESSVQITIAQAFLKGRKLDFLVRYFTELGITKWAPFVAQRSVALPDEKRLFTRIRRWEKIAIEAVKQCNRGQITKIAKPTSFENILNAEGYDLKIVFWENEVKTLNSIFSQTHNKRFNKILAVLGPEGGFTLQEIENAKTCGFTIASLGPRILRAETASIAACVILQYFFGDM